MAANKGKVRFEIVYGKNGQGYGLFCRSFREGKRVLHETVARLPLMTNSELFAMREFHKISGCGIRVSPADKLSTGKFGKKTVGQGS